MRGDEARVVGAFVGWLERDGWRVEREVGFVDVVATRGEQRVYAEVKGRTAAAGLDVDTAYGQLLRRMNPASREVTRYALVVPTEAVGAALRVPLFVRQLLAIDVYEVDDRQQVHLRT